MNFAHLGNTITQSEVDEYMLSLKTFQKIDWNKFKVIYRKEITFAIYIDVFH